MDHYLRHNWSTKYQLINESTYQLIIGHGLRVITHREIHRAFTRNNALRSDKALNHVKEGKVAQFYALQRVH